MAYKVISIHKKRSGRRDMGYTYQRPAPGKVRAQVVEGGITRHIDIDA